MFRQDLQRTTNENKVWNVISCRKSVWKCLLLGCNQNVVHCLVLSMSRKTEECIPENSPPEISEAKFKVELDRATRQQELLIEKVRRDNRSALCLFWQQICLMSVFKTLTIYQYWCVHIFNVFCVLTKSVSPWYNHTGWLGVKHPHPYTCPLFILSWLCAVCRMLNSKYFCTVSLSAPCSSPSISRVPKPGQVHQSLWHQLCFWSCNPP